MKGIIYFTKIQEEYKEKNMEHMLGEKLLETGLRKEYGLELKYEPRGKGEHGKPFFTLRPKLHYNISHSGEYILCIFCGEEVGIDIQKHKKANYERLLERMVPKKQISEILQSDHMVQEFFDQWALREAYIKWTGEGLSKDLRKIPMGCGEKQLLHVEEGYSCAVWSANSLNLTWKYVEVSLL